MKTFHCPACKNKVSHEADVCFDCGQPLTDDIKDQAKKKHYAKQGFWLVLIVAWTIYCFWPASKPEAPDMSKAVAYEITDVSESSAFNRPRIYLDINIPTFMENTPEQYAHTVIKAAWDAYTKMQKEAPNHPAKVYVVEAWAAGGRLIAKATFAIDKKGWDGNTDIEWDVVTMNSKMPPIEYIKTAELWEEMREDYQVPDPLVDGATMIDEKALRAAIAEKLDIPFEMVRVPIVSTGEYLKQ